MLKFRIPYSIYVTIFFSLIRFDLVIALLAGLIVDGILSAIIHAKIIQMFVGRFQLTEDSFFGKLLAQYTYEEVITYNQFWTMTVLRAAAYNLFIAACLYTLWWIVPGVLCLVLATAHLVENEKSDEN